MIMVTGLLTAACVCSSAACRLASTCATAFTRILRMCLPRSTTTSRISLPGAHHIIAFGNFALVCRQRERCDRVYDSSPAPSRFVISATGLAAWVGR